MEAILAYAEEEAMAPDAPPDTNTHAPEVQQHSHGEEPEGSEEWHMAMEAILAYAEEGAMAPDAPPDTNTRAPEVQQHSQTPEPYTGDEGGEEWHVAMEAILAYAEEAAMMPDAPPNTKDTGVGAGEPLAANDGGANPPVDTTDIGQGQEPPQDPGPSGGPIGHHQGTEGAAPLDGSDHHYISFVAYAPTRRARWIQEIYVADQFRGEGVSTWLLAEASSREPLALQVAKADTDTIKKYTHQGLHPPRGVPKVYTQPSNPHTHLLLEADTLAAAPRWAPDDPQNYHSWSEVPPRTKTAMIAGLVRAHAYTKQQAEESLTAQGQGVRYCVIDHLADPGHATGRGARKRPRPAGGAHPAKKGPQPE